MIDKAHLRDTMLALTEDEMAQAAEKYEFFLKTARIDRSEPTENDERAQSETAADLAEAFDDKVHGYQNKLEALKSVAFTPKSEVEQGAVVLMGGRHFVIAVSTAQFECSGHTFVGMSPAAPIFEAIEGKRAGETCTFNGRELTIDEVY